MLPVGYKHLFFTWWIDGRVTRWDAFTDVETELARNCGSKVKIATFYSLIEEDLGMTRNQAIRAGILPPVRKKKKKKAGKKAE